MPSEQDYWNQMYANACDQSAPSLRYRPKLFMDGNQWCALYGENLQDGVAGFGDTPDAAMRNFDHNWNSQKVPGANMPHPLYFESHITIDPIEGSAALGRLEGLCTARGYKLAKLFMDREGQAPSDRDQFMTGHAKHLGEMRGKEGDMVNTLKFYGYKIRRTKIEAVIEDSRERKEARNG